MEDQKREKSPARWAGGLGCHLSRYSDYRHLHISHQRGACAYLFPRVQSCSDGRTGDAQLQHRQRSRRDHCRQFRQDLPSNLQHGTEMSHEEITGLKILIVVAGLLVAINEILNDVLLP